MRKVVDTEVQGNFRVTVFDDDTARVDYLCPGVIKSINEDRPQTNSNGKVFYIATVEAQLTPENIQVGSAIIWENQLTTDKLPKDAFAPGAAIRVAIQAKGEYKGNATVELPGGRFNAVMLDEVLGAFDESAFGILKKEGKELKLGA